MTSLAVNNLDRVPTLMSIQTESSATTIPTSQEQPDTIISTAKKTSSKVIDTIRSQTYPKALTVTKKVINTSIDLLTLTSGLSRLCLTITKSVSAFFQSSQLIQNVVNFLKPIFTYINLAQIALAPLHLYNMFNAIYECFKGEIDLKDCLLQLVRSTGLLVNSIITLLKDLAYIGAIPAKFVSKLWPFDIVGILVSGLTLVISARQWHDSSKFTKEFLKVFDKFDEKDFDNIGEDDYVKIREFILKQDTQRLKRITDVRGQEIQERVSRVCQKALNASEEDSVQAKKEFVEAMNTLKGRVSNKLTSSKVAVAAASIKVVAWTTLVTSTILAVACPITLVATPFLTGASFAASGLADVATIGNFVSDFVKDKKFKNSNFMKLDLKADLVTE